MARAGALMILTELETLVPRHDLRGIVDLAVVAENAGFDAVMLSEHVALGPTANEYGVPANPREYAAPGNQDPHMLWPSSMMMAAAIASATSRIRVVLGALIAPLRHPVILAKELATLDQLSQGRLVFQPTVSWHRDEYAAVGVPFERRGKILDEVLDAMMALWATSPASHEGERYRFEDVYSEPKPFRNGRPTMWLGGQSMHDPLLRRIVRYADGFHPFGSPSEDDLARLRTGLEAGGRSLDELEMIGGTRATFDGPDAVADLDAALAPIGDQFAAGYTTFCMKPSQHTDDVAEVPEICRRMVAHLDAL
jgi:probable F420-dependent oxidoreductase